MRIALVTVGSRGDVQPVLALAAGLRRRGHDAWVVAHHEFAPLARQHGIELRAARGGSPRAIMRSPGGVAAVASANPFVTWRRMLALLRQGARAFTLDAVEACHGADLVGVSGLGVFPGVTAAQRIGRPFFTASPVPLIRTREFPSPVFPPGPSAVPGYNRASHWLSEAFLLAPLARLLRQVRSEMGLEPRFPSLRQVAARALVRLVGVSPAVLPPPGDAHPAPTFCGYWFLDEVGGAPPPALARFLAEGPPPVVVGFGSMSSRDPGRDAETAVEALAWLGRRGVLLSGWAGPVAARLPATVLAVESAPHGALFPCAAAVVHHGGAGTSAAALRAGVPAVVVPFAVDQPFWADRVHRLGAAPAPIPHRALTAARLARALDQALTSAAIRDRARAIGERIRAEDGPASAAVALERAWAAAGGGPTRPATPGSSPSGRETG